MRLWPKRDRHELNAIDKSASHLLLVVVPARRQRQHHGLGKVRDQIGFAGTYLPKSAAGKPAVGFEPVLVVNTSLEFLERAGR